MEKNKVKLTICGTDYNVLSDDNEQYILEIGKEVDKRMTQILNSNSRLSTTMAAILVSLEYCDESNKKSRTIEALKNKESKTKNDSRLDEANFEIELLKEEVNELKNKIEILSEENENLLKTVDLNKQLDDNSSSDGEADCSEEILNFFDFQKNAES